MELQGRVAFVTGGGSGMGRATARRLTAEGMEVCVADINGDTAKAVADEIGGMAVTVDVSDFEALDAAINACEDRFGRLDLAYLNAGIAGGGNMLDFSPETYRRVCGINLDGVVFGTAAALKHMRNRADGSSSGAIVATASIAGIVPFGPDPFYSLTKHAVVGFIRAVGESLAPEGITAHAICPGMTDTGLLSEGTKARMVALGRPIIPAEDIAAAVVKAVTAPVQASGTCWVVQYGRPSYAFAFRDIEGHEQFKPAD
jgi:NAD(P)-dependent dehydrogenase (short-subunit alcohol dehydrogenase family)